MQIQYLKKIVFNNASQADDLILYPREEDCKVIKMPLNQIAKIMVYSQKL